MAFGLLTSCKNSKKSDYVSSENIENNQIHPGKKLMETHCYICHSPTASEEVRIAPPMIAIKKHYIDNDTSKESFKYDLQAWVNNPTNENAKMFGAVQRFGVMPKVVYPEETINQIADYIFENEIEQPEWFDAHYNKERGMANGKGMGKGIGNGMGRGKGKGVKNQQSQTNLENLSYGERGLKDALATKAVLGKNLMGSLQGKGLIEVLAFCNEEANVLTDSMSVVHNATIKRVSDKPRNVNNQANSKELAYIDIYKKQIERKQEPQPIVEELGDLVHVYYPITTNSMCLQCHGKPEVDIEPKTLKSLANLYPYDKAIGYEVNQVRGIWSVSFRK